MAPIPATPFWPSPPPLCRSLSASQAHLRPVSLPPRAHRTASSLRWLLLALLLTLLLALLLRLRQQWRGWPLGEPACTCRRCCVKPLAERRWQSTHGRQALKKTAVPEPARELPLAKQARALRRPHAAGCPGRCAIAPAGSRGSRGAPRSGALQQGERREQLARLVTLAIPPGDREFRS